MSHVNRLSPWIPTFVMMLVSLISYVDRNVLAILSPTIRAQVHLSEAQYGWVISGFSIAYMIGNPVWGWILDRYGLRWGMSAAVLFWTIASASHAFVSEFWGLAIARILLGFGEGATFPGGLRAVMQSLPPSGRARGVAIAYSGGSLGAILAPLIVTPINASWGWRATFLFTGLIGIAWIVIWQFVAGRDDMRQVQMTADSAASATESPQYGDSRTWAFMLSYALGGAPLAFILYYTASYLKSTFGLDQVQIGHLLWIPPLGWEVGYFFWGWVTDRAHRSARFGGTPKSPLRVERSLFLLLTVLSLFLMIVPHVPSLALVMCVKFVAMANAAGFIIVAISYATKIYSINNAGLIAGLGAGTWGAGAAITSPLFGYLFDLERFDVAYLIAALLPLAGFLLWNGLAGFSARRRSPDFVSRGGDK